MLDNETDSTLFYLQRVCKRLGRMHNLLFSNLVIILLSDLFLLHVMKECNLFVSVQCLCVQVPRLVAIVCIVCLNSVLNTSSLRSSFTFLHLRD